MSDIVYSERLCEQLNYSVAERLTAYMAAHGLECSPRPCTIRENTQNFYATSFINPGEAFVDTLRQLEDYVVSHELDMCIIPDSAGLLWKNAQVLISFMQDLENWAVQEFATRPLTQTDAVTHEAAQRQIIKDKKNAGLLLFMNDSHGYTSIGHLFESVAKNWARTHGCYFSYPLDYLRQQAEREETAAQKISKPPVLEKSP